MRVACRVDDNEVGVVARSFMDAVDQIAFMIVLKRFDEGSDALSLRDQRSVNGIECGESIVLWLAAAQ